MNICKTCQFFDAREDYGFCRRYAPKRVSVYDMDKIRSLENMIGPTRGMGQMREISSQWPMVENIDWCGEYKATRPPRRET